MTNNKTGEFSKHYLFAGQISYTGEANKKFIDLDFYQHIMAVELAYYANSNSLKAFQKAFKKIYLCFEHEIL